MQFPSIFTTTQNTVGKEFLAVNKLSRLSWWWPNHKIKIHETSFTRQVFNTWHTASISIMKYFETIHVWLYCIVFDMPPSRCPLRVLFSAPVGELDRNEIFAAPSNHKIFNHKNFQLRKFPIQQ